MAWWISPSHFYFINKTRFCYLHNIYYWTPKYFKILSHFFVSAKKWHKKPRELYLRSLFNCSARPKRLNSDFQSSNNSRFVIVLLTLNAHYDRLTKGAKAEHCLKHEVQVCEAEEIGRSPTIKETAERSEDVENLRGFFFFGGLSFSLPRKQRKRKSQNKKHRVNIDRFWSKFKIICQVKIINIMFLD